ncbi:mannose-1-phosphate guanylyltransferase [Brachybacterium fresconis]|uniref:Mannose-1-phosphate guanylyltransferase n=1 Tax=Brachybacterium fresconis TaxID=173363 RepID=A0ABS4YHG6_9MICO|nr:mannose-1-phosphate guanylyltransferase [Brachybacterium fresconis]MBP2408247.1 mannose-1-phosphate guanylyltransferase [Brachybacterium fresconis]
MPEAPFVPVIPAGGAGTRLWPLSRRAHPKFLLDLTGSGRSLLQQTLARLAPLTDRAPIIVTGVEHAEAVTSQAEGLVGPRARVLAEPSPRDSMPAIALAAALVEREEPEAVIGSFAADHLIGDEEAFVRAVTTARRTAELGYLVTLGVTPTRPATGFGYIEQGTGAQSTAGAAGGAPGTATAAAGDGGSGATALDAVGARPVARFVEKPDRDRAEQFLAAGTFSWNAGIFVARARVLLDELAAQIPSLARGVRAIAAAHGTARYQEVLERIWPQLTRIAIDHALAEPLAAAGRVALVPADFAWDDIGDFAALARQLRASPPVGSAGAAEPNGDVAGGDVQVLGTADVGAVSSTATVYGSRDRPIALVGLEGISIVDTEDVLLVLADDRAQDLSRLVAGLDGTGHGHLR